MARRSEDSCLAERFKRKRRKRWKGKKKKVLSSHFITCHRSSGCDVSATPGVSPSQISLIGSLLLLLAR